MGAEMSKLNLPMFLLTGVPLVDGKPSSAEDWIDIVVFAFFGLLFLALVALLIMAIILAAMYQPTM